MKKILLCAAIACATLFSSCSSDDDTADQTGIQTGTYILTSIKTNVPVDTDGDNILDGTEIFDAISCPSILELSETGYSWIQLYLDQRYDIVEDNNGNYSYNYLDLDCGTETFDGTSSFGENTVTLTEVSLNQELQYILLKEGNTLQYSKDEHLKITEDSTGESRKDVIVTYVFTKQ